MPLASATWQSASQKHQDNKQRFLFKGFCDSRRCVSRSFFNKTLTCQLNVSYSLLVTFFLFWKETFLRNVSINSGFSSLGQNNNLAWAGVWILLPPVRDGWRFYSSDFLGLGTVLACHFWGSICCGDY